MIKLLLFFCDSFFTLPFPADRDCLFPPTISASFQSLRPFSRRSEKFKMALSLETPFPPSFLLFPPAPRIFLRLETFPWTSERCHFFKASEAASSPDYPTLAAYYLCSLFARCCFFFSGRIGDGSHNPSRLRPCKSMTSLTLRYLIFLLSVF